jgi:phage-related baseplate assembly protein
VTRGQAAEYRAVQDLAREHRPLLAGLREGHVITKSVALQVAKWTRAIPDQFRAQAEEIVIAAARAGADLRALAAICAEICYRTAPPDPDNDPRLDRGLGLDTTIDGAGVIRGDLTPQCAAMVQAVLDALSAPQGGGDLRTCPQRYHDALEEAMR